jgi:hypothetical protein
VSDKHKGARIRLLIATGMSHEDALLVDDLSRHAVDKAIEALNVVAKTAPPHLMAKVFLVASKVAASSFQGFLEELAKETIGDIVDEMIKKGLI